MFRKLTRARKALVTAHGLPTDVVEVLADLQKRIADLERESNRVAPQLAALEARVEDLREQIAAAPVPGSSADQDEARSLVEEVRTEHARVRARITAATVFEERLRVLEERVG